MKRSKKRSCCRWKFVGSEKETKTKTKTGKKTKTRTDKKTKTKTKTKTETKTKFVGSEKEMYYQRRSSYCSVSLPDDR